MKRLSSILAVGMLVATVAACSGSTGGLGSVPTAAPIPSDEPGLGVELDEAVCEALPYSGSQLHLEPYAHPLTGI